MVAENKTEERSKTENRKEQTDENGKNERQKTEKKKERGGCADCGRPLALQPPNKRVSEGRKRGGRIRKHRAALGQGTCNNKVESSKKRKRQKWELTRFTIVRYTSLNWLLIIFGL